MSLSLSPSLPSFPSLFYSLIFPLPFSDSSLNRMLILTGGFQSCGTSFSSWCALQVHQHKVTLLFKKGSCFFLPAFSLLSLLCLVSKKTWDWEKQRFKVIVTAIRIHVDSEMLSPSDASHFVTPLKWRKLAFCMGNTFCIWRRVDFVLLRHLFQTRI